MNQRQKRQCLSLPPFSFVASVLSLVFRQNRQPTSARTRQKLESRQNRQCPSLPRSPIRKHIQRCPPRISGKIGNRIADSGRIGKCHSYRSRLAGSWPNPSRSSLRPQSPISGKNGNHISVALRVLRGYTSYSGRIGNRFPPAPNKKSEIPAESAITVASPHGEGYPPRRRVL